MQKWLMVVFLTCSAGSMQVIANDFGKVGSTFDITEQGFLAMLQDRMQMVDIEELQKKLQALAKEQVLNPKPLQTITPALETKEFFYDPEYLVTSDILDHNNNIVVPAGTIVNPFSTVSLDCKLVFADAREQKQIEYLRELVKYAKTKAEFKIILTAGSPIMLEEELDYPVYFDQHSEITKKLGIKHTLAIVEQVEKKLKITEVSLEGQN